eukprot:jgi/Galph1/4859/GphlegSOOS_G3596.1
MSTRSTRNREGGRARSKIASEAKEIKQDDISVATKEKGERTQTIEQKVICASCGRNCNEDITETYSKGTQAASQLLEQQKKRIEQLEKDLADARVEIERLRLYNRQLALGLTSLHRQGFEANRLDNCQSPLFSQTAGPCQHLNNRNHACCNGHCTESVVATGSSGNQNQEESSEATSKVQKKTQSRYWTADEHMRFLEGLARFGHKDMKAIAKFVGTRNATQVRTHAQKYYLKLAREAAKRQEQQQSVSGRRELHISSADQAKMTGRKTNPNQVSFSYKKFKGSMSAPGTPVYQNLFGKRNSSNEEYYDSPTYDFSSARYENDDLLMHRSRTVDLADFSYRDMNFSNRNEVNEGSRLHIIPLEEESSGEFSATSDRLSDIKSFQSSLPQSEFFDLETSDELMRKSESHSYAKSEDNRLMQCVDKEVQNFHISPVEVSDSTFDDLNRHQFSVFPSFSKEAMGDRGISSFECSARSPVEFDDTLEVARSIVECDSMRE